jgi:uncharacterized membrane protein
MTVQQAPLSVAAESSLSQRVVQLAVAHRWQLVVWGGMAVWSGVLFAVVRSDYLGFGVASPFDLGDMVQAVWNTAHGHPLRMTTLNAYQSRLAYHVDPVLVLFAPLWLLWPSPLSLAATQIVACALGALPVLWLGRRHLASERAAALMALAYLAYPWLAWSASDAMHPVTLAIPLFLYAIWFLDTGKLVRFGVCAVLIAATGELMGLTIAALGVWYALVLGRRRAGVVIAVLGIAWSVVAVKLIVPAFLGHQSVYYAQYEAVGGSPGGIVRTLFTDPGAIASKLFSGDNLALWFWLSLPLLGLFALAPWLALVALPELLVNGLSSQAVQSDATTHYVAGVIPFLLAATTLGLARLSPGNRVKAAVAVFGVSTALFVVLGPFPKMPLRESTWQLSRPDSAHAEALRAAVDLVPPSASVTSNDFLHPELAARRFLYTFPFVGRSDWVVLDSRPARPLEPGAETFRARVARDRRWLRVFSEDGVFVYRRVSAT